MINPKDPAHSDLPDHGITIELEIGETISPGTHSALLINIQPIKQETAEDLLREFIKRHDASTENCDWKVRDDDLLERARKLITCDKPPYNITEHGE